MENYKSLLVTLGHNSSAIFIDGEHVIGYEQERLSGIKADSQFPMDAINEIVKHVGLKAVKGCDVYVSHWFDTEKSHYEFVPTKYMTDVDYENLKAISRNIIFVDSTFTHHDAHAFSAMAFFNYHRGWAKVKHEPVYTIVADGFGTNQEAVSIYMSTDEEVMPKLVKRVNGYAASLGLMYQYATSYCGMKENQDEYKFLGYESHIDECFTEKAISTILSYAEENVAMLKLMFEHGFEDVKTTPGFINISDLRHVKARWHNIFNELDKALARFNAPENCMYDDTFRKRVAVGFFVQYIIESYFTSIVNDYNMKNVVCAGGCFYNVKLNNAILSSIDGVFSVVPLAGDQGAAIGMYYKFTNAHFPFGTLAIGKRRLYNIEKLLPKGAYYRKLSEDTRSEIVNELAQLIADGNIVNLIFGDMEFGPRALCNTSTLMLPSAENVADNNTMNGRNEVMPCAPVVAEYSENDLFDASELERVIGSDYFMICTHNYVKQYSKQYAGVMHKKPMEQNLYTGRPQIAREGTFMYDVLVRLNSICDAKCIVNTSFNVHGRPIAFDTTEILQNYEYQKGHARIGKGPILYIVDAN